MTQTQAQTPVSSKPAVSPQRRMVKRVTVDYPAALHTVWCKLDGRIADISPKGAKLCVGQPVDIGGSARLLVEGREIFCDVIWSDGEACGIKFERALPPELLALILKDADESLSPVACTDWIPMGRKRGGRLVCDE